jgi:hypothetical protein
LDRTAQPVKMCFVRGLLNLAKLNRTARRDAAALQLHGPLKCYLLIYSGVYIYIYIYIYIYMFRYTSTIQPEAGEASTTNNAWFVVDNTSVS